ncbi:concanavalin A-like lectin/glucanase domain-containing protein [Xylariaceae sp. FL0662B]|nr:concanavalin A-like lectin/glucanase domain-containing protein [Xylariaceae sp. FL0662B]
MFSKLLSTTAVVLATTQLVAAQTHTDCNPMTNSSCPADPALDGTITVDFSKGENKFFKEADYTKLTYNNEGAVFTIKTEKDAPTITSTQYLFFGKVDVKLKASTGQGVVTSFVLQSDDLDEIDWEWLGGDTTQVQSNYFGKGDTTTYDRGAYHNVNNPQTETHTYTVDWTKDYVRWLIDGNQVRELKYADAKGGSRFPQTPMQVKLGTWVAGRSDAPEGTVQWAGGKTDFSQAPFVATYEQITIQNYNNGVKGHPKQYVWADGSDGSYQSIKIEFDDGTSDDTGDDTTTSSSSAETTKTESAGESSSTKSSDNSTTTASTATTSATGSASATASDSTSETGTATSDSGSSSSPSQTGADATASSTDAPEQAGAATMGFSGAVLGACLLSVLFL